MFDKIDNTSSVTLTIRYIEGGLQIFNLMIILNFS